MEAAAAARGAAEEEKEEGRRRRAEEEQAASEGGGGGCQPHPPSAGDRLRRATGSPVEPLGPAGSGQVLHREEHDHTGEQHPTDHEVLVLESPLLNEPHHRVGQAQHVGDVEDLLLRPLQGQSLGPQSLQNTVPASNEVIHAVVNFLEGGVKLQ